MIELKLEEGVSLPQYKEGSGTPGVSLCANFILAVYKGDKKVEEDRLSVVREGFERGHIMLRPFERILFGTGVSPYFSRDFQITLKSDLKRSLEQGLIVLNDKEVLNHTFSGEISILLYNSTPFLSRVNKGDVIAEMLVEKHQPRVVIK